MLRPVRESRKTEGTLSLYRTSDASEPNILPGLLDQLTKTYGREITPEDFAAYLYGVLAHPAFAKHYSEQLETRELRVPMTRDRGLFEALREAGVKLLRLHSYGERFVPDGEPRGRVSDRISQVHEGRSRQCRRLPGVVPARRRGSNPARGPRRVRGCRTGGLRIRGVGSKGRAVVAPIPHEERRGPEVFTPRQHPPRAVDFGVNHRITRTSLGARNPPSRVTRNSKNYSNPSLLATAFGPTNSPSSRTKCASCRKRSPLKTRSINIYPCKRFLERPSDSCLSQSPLLSGHHGRIKHAA